MVLLLLLLGAMGAACGLARVHEHPGSKAALSPDRYIRVVSETESPVQPIYVKTRDSLYVAARSR